MADITAVNIGDAADDGTGDPLRTAFDKLNDNDEALNTELAGKASNTVSAASKLLGRGDSGSGDVQEITIGSGLSISGTTISAAGAGLPTDDTNPLVQDPVDPTKRGRMDVGAVAAETTRAIIMGDRDVDLALGGTFAELSHTHAAADITSGELPTARLADGAVTSGKLADGAVVTAKIADASVEGAKIANAAVGSTHIVAGAVTTDKIASGGVGSTQLADLAVTTAKIAAAAVTEPKITDGAVTTDKIADSSVTSNKLDSTGVTAATYTRATITVGADGRISAASSNSAGGGGGLDYDDTTHAGSTAIDVDEVGNGKLYALRSGSAITLTLGSDIVVGTKVGFNKEGAGAVTVGLAGGAAYWVPGDDIDGSNTHPATFGVVGQVEFTCIRNTGGSAAEWVVVGQTDLAQTLDGDLDAAGNDITNVAALEVDGTATFNGALVVVEQGISGNYVLPVARGAGSSQPTEADSGKWITTDGAITIPNEIGWHCNLEIGANTHDITHNSIALDISAASFAAGEVYSVYSKSATAIRISGPAGQFTEADFA